MSHPLRILHLEDKKPAVELARSLLEEGGFACNVQQVESKKDFLHALKAENFDLIFADYTLPQFDGLSALALARQRCPDTPFIFLSGKMGEEAAIESLKQGATDYVLKQRIERLVPSVQRALKETETRINEKRLEEQMHYMAFYDALTGLPNRSLLKERIEQCIKRMSRHKDYMFAVLFLDLDRFKHINDSFDHSVGDEVLVEIGKKLRSCVRTGDTVARIGGDEFAILLDDIHGIKDTTQPTKRILSLFQLPLKLSDRSLYTSPSIGVTVNASPHSTPEDILRDADIAMYDAKDEGGACYKFYDSNIQERIIENLKLEMSLRSALEKKELEVYYQPIFLLATGKIKGFEALLRWHHPVLGMVPPAKFIPVAEESGLILPIGEWVLQEALAQTVAWNRTVNHPLFISVNISAKQAQHKGLLQIVNGTLRRVKLKPNLLKLEITESAILEQLRSIEGLFNRLRHKTIEISLDDFGTGYSSLSHLFQFPVDVVKIDVHFTNQMLKNKKKAKIVEATIQLAHALGMKVVAEGVETKEQLHRLKTLQCDYGQGFLLGKPLPADKTTALLQRTWR